MNAHAALLTANGPLEAGRLPEPVPEAPLSDEAFRRLAACWRESGAFLALWSREGATAAFDDQSPRFWSTLWAHGSGFRDGLRQRVESILNESASTTNPPGNDVASHNRGDWLPSIAVLAIPIRMRRRIKGVLTACFRLDDCNGESFQRLCTQWSLDFELLRSLASDARRVPNDAISALTGPLTLAIEQARDIDTARMESLSLSGNLETTYEELQLIYRVSAEMGLPQRPIDMLARVGQQLVSVSRAAGVAFVLGVNELNDTAAPPAGTSLESRVVQCGRAAPELADVDRLAECVLKHPAAPAGHILLNGAGQRPEFEWSASWLRHVVALPLVHNKRMLGVLMAVNCTDADDFTSVDIQLFRAVADRVAAFLENQRLYDDLADLLMGMLHAMVNSIDAKDPYTCGHSERVAFLSRLIARSAGLSPVECQRVYLGGLLHDVGKIGIPDAILCKPGKLTTEEFDELKKHPEIGVRILLRIRQIRDLMPGVLYHHERMDGRGYPHGLSGGSIPRIGRIICLADCFDAMTTSRTYRAALPLPMAIAEIRRCAGTQFDPELAELFLQQDLPQAMNEARAFSGATLSLSQIGALTLGPGAQVPDASSVMRRSNGSPDRQEVHA